MDLGKLYAGAVGAVSTVSDIILVSPDNYLGIIPSNKSPNKKGFVFHIVGEEAVNLQSDITDHFVENNTSMQDHIALRPETITISGFIGELNNVTPDELLPLKDVIDRIGMLGGYLPAITATALRAYNTADQLYRVAKKAKQAYKKLKGDVTGQSAQSIAFNDFYNYFLSRQLFYVQTPYMMFSNMAILSMRTTQSDSDKNSSDFEITFKKVRMAQTLLTKKKTEARGAGAPVNKGLQRPI